MDSKKNLPGIKLLALFLVFLALSACAGAPVQEMSDARQAIQAAESINDTSQSNLIEAKKFLQKAEQALHVGEYKEARVNAIAARYQALQAQQFSSTANF